MKTIYFIDNESIKRTAKAIQKTNPTFKYTVILDDLSKILGYSSYNQYEHYLTNIMLSNSSGLDKIKALTKINSIELVLLKRKFLQELSEKSYSVDTLHFVDKIISNQQQGFLEHSYLDLKSYVYYLPFVFKDIDRINFADSNLINSHELQDIIKIVMDYYQSIDISAVKSLVEQFKSNPDCVDDSNFCSQYNSYNTNLKTRGIYYYIKSVIEDFDYDEAILTKLILNGDSVEKIEHELNYRIDKINDIQIPVFFKKDKQSFVNDYFPFIQSSISENKPLIFGKHVDKTPFFAEIDYLRSNISLLGVPGTGKGSFLYTFIFQLLMNNRGVCIMNTAGETFMDRYITHIASFFNKKDDVFVFNKDSNIRTIAGAVHNDKILLTSCARKMDARRGIDIHETGRERFEAILTGLTEYFFTSKFRTKKLPFYIILEESHMLTDISVNAKIMIEKLNALNIFFLFDSQVYEKSIHEICDTQLISNSSFWCLTKSANFEFSQLMKKMDANTTLIGKTGPSKALPPVFSLIHKEQYVDQFIIEVDDGLFENLPNP
jgi:hypothetical protein